LNLIFQADINSKFQHVEAHAMTILKDKQAREEEARSLKEKKSPRDETINQNRSPNNPKKCNELILEVRPLQAGVFLFKQNKPNELEQFLSNNDHVLDDGSLKEKFSFKTEASLSKEKVLLTSDCCDKEKISFMTSVSDDFFVDIEIQKAVQEKVQMIKEKVVQAAECSAESRGAGELKSPRSKKTSHFEVTKRLTKDMRVKDKEEDSMCADKKSDLETRARVLKEKKLKLEELRLLKEKKANEEIARILREKKLKEDEDRVVKQKRLKEIEEKLLKDKKSEEEEKARLIREKKLYEEQKARLVKEKRMKEEQERLLKVKKAKEDEERMIKEKKIREENARLLKVKLLKEEEIRLLAKKKAIEEEKVRTLREKKQRDEEKTRLCKEKKEREVVEKARIQLKEKLLEKCIIPKAQNDVFLY
jgi:hypothetical protein